MLDVNNVLPTLYKDRKMKIFSGFDDVVVDEKRKTKDERRRSKKRTVERRKLIFKTNALVPKPKCGRRGRYRSGVSPTFPQLAVSSGRTGSVLPWKPSAFSRKAPLTTENVLLTKRT
jgi:hypothetical protein